MAVGSTSEQDLRTGGPPLGMGLREVAPPRLRALQPLLETSALGSSVLSKVMESAVALGRIWGTGGSEFTELARGMRVNFPGPRMSP